MRIVKKEIAEAVEWTENHEAYVNPYYGCSAGCPFCYWLNIPGWEGTFEVRTNIVSALEDFCSCSENAGCRIYFGSYGDPYADELERDFQLTRQCLEMLQKMQRPVTISTSARSNLILRDIDLLKQIPNLTVITELCRLDQLERLAQGQTHIGVDVSNDLHRAGVRVIGTFAPILPGITDSVAVRAALDPAIPLYIDPMYIQGNSIQAQRLIAFIQKEFPKLENLYRKYFEKDSETCALFERYVLSLANHDNTFMMPFEEET